MARLTVKDLLDARGKHQFSMLRVETLEEAEAAAKAGVELFSVPPAMIFDRRFREVAPDAFAFPGDNFYEIGTTDDFLKWAFPLYKAGADAFYCSGSMATIRAMADHGLPVCGHVGLIPSKRTWTGGFKAVGKTLDSAKLVWNQVRAAEEAGAFAVEIEVVPHSITQAIAEKTDLFLISMGAGAGGHAQYLFSDDVLGQNRGRIPRHAKVYANFAAEYDRLQQLRIEAMGKFVADVHGGHYPAPQYLVDADAEVVQSFRDWLDQNAGSQSPQKESAMRFALNHIISPRQSLAQFFAMARALGVTEVEIRNDLSGAPIQDGTKAADVKAAASAAGVTLISINALYPFNVWDASMQAKATAMADYAAEAGAKALVMCPLNENKPVSRGSLVAALGNIAPILKARGLTGLVEPLGFPRSSMRTKAEALSAIDEVGGADTYKLVHDTFHHHLAGETAFYPERTGLVHISGVTDPALTVANMEDAHRVLVDAADRLGNIAQIQHLIAAGYAGPFSFEPFAAEVQALDDPQTALSASMALIRTAL